MIGKDPFGAMVLTVGVCLTGAFALVLHTGASSRQAKEMHYDFNFQGAAAAVTSVFDDVQRGGKVLQSKTGQFFAGFFGGETAGYTASAAAGGTAVEQQADVQDGDDGGFKWSEGRDYGEDEQAAGSSLGDGYEARFGGGSSGSSASSDEAAVAAAPAAARKKAGAGQVKPEAAADDKLPPLPGRGYSAGRGGTGIAALRRGYANLADNGGARVQTGGASAGGVSGGYRPGSYGGTSGRFAGGQAGGAASWDKSGSGAMDAAMDSLRSGAQSSYNSSVGKGAPSVSAAAASSGKAGPAASAAAEVSGASGGSGAGSSDKTAGSPAAAVSKSPSYSYSPYSSYSDTDQAEVSLIKSVVTERLKGGESKYITRDGVAALDESLLKAGAVPADTLEKSAEVPEADPAKFKELSAARQAELKKEIHVFLRQVEGKYGAMADIFSTPCSQAAEVCAEHGLTEAYMTMTTVKGYKLVLGVKYVESRWRRYTISFKK